MSFGFATICRWWWMGLGIVLAALGLLMFQAPPRAAASEVPDASCAGPPESFQTNTGVTRHAQTFTAQNTGTLTSAQLEVDSPVGSTAGDWVVDILNTAAGVPVDGVLATDTVPDTTVPGAGGFITATFATPASVTAGQVYALEFSRPASTMTGEGERDGDDCPGQLFSAGAAPGTFSAGGHTGADLVFSVTVNVPATPPVPTPPGVTPPGVTPSPPSQPVVKKKCHKHKRHSASVAKKHCKKHKKR